MEHVNFNGWDCIRLVGGKAELLVTRDVGPRIVRYGIIGGANMMAEIPEDIGGHNETVWKNRGGYRLWIAPEAENWSYELDNTPYKEAIAIPNGLRTIQEAGAFTHLEKRMDITMDPSSGAVKIINHLTNRASEPVNAAIWCIAACGTHSRAIIPLYKPVAPTMETLTARQRWSTWCYTDFSDPRWQWTPEFLFLSQDVNAKTPQKIGYESDIGWLGFERENCLMIKKYSHKMGENAPDFGANVQLYTNSAILELEQLGPLSTIAPGETISLVEEWRLFDNFAPCKDEADVKARILPLL